MTVAATQKLPANPWDEPTYNPNPPTLGTDTALSGAAKVLPGAAGAVPNVVPPKAPTIDPQVTTTATKTSAAPSVLNAGPGLGEPAAPTVLPDGSGGSVPVPPAAIAPPGVVPPPAAAPANPWDQTTFSGDSNVINTQITPNGLPDRNKMALDQYNTWDAETAPQLAHSITDATDAAAAHGQIRSGQLTNRYGDLARQRVLDQTTARSKYMQGALDSSINDSANNRNEQRTERGYQRSLAEQAIAQRIAQQQAETGQAVTQFKAGNSAPDPTGALNDAASLAGGESAQSSSDMAALIRAWLARQQPVAA